MHREQLIIVLPFYIEHDPAVDREKHQCGHDRADQFFEWFVHGSPRSEARSHKTRSYYAA